MSANTAPNDTREALIRAARDVFARKGLDGTTVKEIADAAGVNISLISYHFEGKDGLFRACVEEFGKERLAVAQRMLSPVASSEEFRIRLSLFVEEILSAYARDADVCRMMHRECESESELIQDIFEKTFLEVFKSLVKFLDHAKQNSILHADLEAHIAGAILMGGIAQFGMKDTLAKRHFGRSIQDDAYRAEIVRQTTQLWIDGALKRPSDKS